MGKKRKRRVNNMAWGKKRFRSRYQWENNPGIEPTEVSKDDDEITFTYIHSNNKKEEYTAKQFFENKLYKLLPAVSDGIMLAWDYPKFRAVFQRENNPSIDPYIIKKGDDNIHLLYVNQYGIKSRYTSKKLFEKRLWEIMPYKRPEYEMAMDYEEFRNTFQKENNPGVDPYTLRKWRDYTPLIHINQYGIVTNYNPERFFNKRLWEIMPYRRNEYEMAMDYKEFRDTFQQENNPGVDPYTLRKWYDDTPLVHISKYGVITYYSPERFFRERLWETMPYRKYEMAMDYKEFRDTFQQENNPGVNPYTLRKWYDDTPLVHINRYEVITKYSPHSFFGERMWETMPYKRYEMAMDYKEFQETFQQENNPEVDPYTLRKWYDYTPLVHINQFGVLIKYSPHRFFGERMWETMPYTKKKAKKEKHKAPQKHIVHEMAMNYPEFVCFFQSENNPGVDPYTLKKWRDYTPLIHINQYGVVTHYTPHYFFHKRIWEYVPYRQYKPGETVNALALDEDIALYVKTEKDREKLLNTGVHTKKAFHCPFCGNDFSKKLIDMINCSPKCPFCNDTGMYEEASDDEINGAYLKRT